VLAAGLAAYGAVGSYATVSTLAANVGVPLPKLVPIGMMAGCSGSWFWIWCWRGQVARLVGFVSLRGC
jgi:hypothetical protein